MWTYRGRKMIHYANFEDFTIEFSPVVSQFFVTMNESKRQVGGFAVASKAIEFGYKLLEKEL